MKRGESWESRFQAAAREYRSAIYQADQIRKRAPWPSPKETGQALATAEARIATAFEAVRCLLDHG